MKIKSLKNKFFAGLLALTLCTSTFTTIAHANPGEAKPVNLQIKKVLNMPETGVTTPNYEYKFVFTKHSLNRDEGKKNELPDINTVNINGFAATMTTDADSAKAGRQVTKNSSNILDGVTFTKSGQYTYTVSEIAGDKSGMTYSKASYTVSIFVEKKGENFIPTSVQIAKTMDDKGTPETSPTKQEYTPDGGTSKNNFVFNNNYDPKTGNDNPTGKEITDADKKGFVLKKEIAGATPNLDEAFKFNVTATKPKGSNSDATTFKYKIVGQDGTAGAVETGTYGTAFDVTLKHGERVVFSDVLLGTTVKAEETVDGGYTKSIKSGSKINGTVVTVDNLKTGLAIGDNADGNSVVFVNTQQTATGIILNNLPFIAIVLVAGLGIFFFVKNRREEEAEA